MLLLGLAGALQERSAEVLVTPGSGGGASKVLSKAQPGAMPIQSIWLQWTCR